VYLDKARFFVLAPQGQTTLYALESFFPCRKNCQVLEWNIFTGESATAQGVKPIDAGTLSFAPGTETG
jgi:hypothetical protein